MLSDKEFFNVTDAAECKHLLKHSEANVLNMSEAITAISEFTGVEYPWLHGFACESPFNLNGEKHKHVRRMVASYFSGKRIKSWEPIFQDIIRDVVASTEDQARIDLLDDWVRPIAHQCSYYAVGLKPNLDPSFTRHIDQLLSLTSFKKQRKLKDFAAFDESARAVAEYIKENRLPRDAADDNDLYHYLTSQFALPVDLVCSQITIVLSASTSMNHTLVNVLSDLLALTPAKRAELIAELGVEELLERSLYMGGGVGFLYRTLNGSDVYCLNIAAANKDSVSCPFSASEKPGSKHLAFGHGVHKCIGEMMSRRIMTLTLKAIFERYPSARIYEKPKQQVFTDTPYQQITVDVEN
ncbi:cytochrome P450 [Idiomarina fontislapidosi]|uniref:Cytochrome P450 n=1 Tax=Idiomarina fontislapidosi TaxID=263723 RepID=A0A432XQU1_9GAMM|nr:cytochrome P450 [Idiomarina fontislapidosi]PYE30728.1 cytochrome P450 [Idiomarina fontislapidosi]RUO51105.1 hypothetical protein CWE25_11900 [Idiomarina fontislapidosi]|tara:strand:+ start:4357 stop:5418 length:1062 start_codon:yes stop_codon:yes gene_type:complete